MRRQLTGYWLYILKGIAVAFALFHIFAAGYGAIPDMRLRALHVLGGLILTFMIIPGFKRPQPESKVHIYDILLIVITIATTMNAYLKYVWYNTHIGESAPFDIAMGIAAIVLVIEAGRRVVGWALPILATTLFLYSLFGYLVPGVFYHSGLRFEFVMQNLYQGTQGVWGFVTGVSAQIIAIFIVFGSLLLFTGGGQTFIDLALRVAGRFRGGPALVAVIASALFGTISGTATANVVTTGNFTIPLMKRLGYKPEFAGAVEAAASSGGILTPPIMGAGAFVMAEILAVPYLHVIKAAAIPAFLYYIALFTAVRFKALRLNLAPIPAEQIPRWQDILTWKRLSPLLLPIAVLLYMLLIGHSAQNCAFSAAIAAIILFLFSNFSPSQMMERLKQLVNALQHAGITLIEIVALSACANIVVSLICLTGLGVKFSSMIIDTAGTFLLLALALAAIATIIIGMGMPATASYLVAVSILGPSLAMLGAIPLAAHLFIFYFAVFSAITPPICVAAFAAAVIAKASWVKIAFNAIPLAIVGYVIPFVFVYEPALLMMGEPLQIFWSVVTAALGAVLLGAGVAGYLTDKLRLLVRLLFIPAGVLLLVPGWETNWIGFAVAAVALIGQIFIPKKLS